MGQLTGSHKAQIVAYRNANLSMAEIGRKIGFHKSAICKFLSVNSGGMSAFGDFAVLMSFPREGTQAQEPKTKLLPIGNLLLFVSKLKESFNDSLTTP